MSSFPCDLNSHSDFSSHVTVGTNNQNSIDPPYVWPRKTEKKRHERADTLPELDIHPPIQNRSGGNINFYPGNKFNCRLNPVNHRMGL